MATQTPVVHSGERAAPHLCGRDERTFFACQTSRQRSISLCGNLPRDLQYRFGAVTKIELRFPENASGGANAFEFAHYFRYRTQRTEVSFRNGGTEYALFDYTEEDGRRDAGVRVTVNGKESRIVCSGKITSRLTKLESILPCDPDNALNMGVCRPRP